MCPWIMIIEYVPDSWENFVVDYVLSAVLLVLMHPLKAVQILSIIKASILLSYSTIVTWRMMPNS